MFHEVEDLEEEEPPIAADPLIHISEKKQKKKNQNIIWKHVAGTQNNETSFSEPLFDKEIQIQEPLEYFNSFISHDLKNLIVIQSNLYSLQKDVTKPLNMSVAEFEQWLGLCMYFSISKIFNIRLHWNANFLNNTVNRVMSRNRWLTIKANLHFSNNENTDHRDKVYKIRPLYDELKIKFKQIPRTENLCIDEQMIPFTRKSALKQYIPKKPYKRGLKLFFPCDVTGIVYGFVAYTGKITPVDDPAVPDLGPSSNVVLQLAQSIPPNKNHKLIFDNWFTSLQLLTYLASQGIWCCRTVQARRLPSLKFKLDLDLCEEGRGSKDIWKAKIDDITVVAMKWQDTRSVCLVSIFTAHLPEGICSRYDKKQKAIIEVSHPNIVAVYCIRKTWAELICKIK